MPRDRAVMRVRNALAVIAAGAALWAAAVAATGGFAAHAGGVRLSSRNPGVPAAVAVVSAAVAALLTRRSDFDRIRRVYGQRAAIAAGIVRYERTLTAATAVALSLAVVVVGVTRGAFEAGNSDASGYVSQAALWTKGSLFVTPAIVDDARWRRPVEMLTPLGYRPSRTDPHAMVPIYPPGLPIVMAIFQVIGGRPAVFYVVPLLGGLFVLSTYLIGLRIDRPIVALTAALLASLSPPFVLHLLQPMSDVPAAAWWACALAFVPLQSTWSALVAGASASLAILTRPNLAPAVIAPAAWLVFTAWRVRAWRGVALRRLLLFCAVTVSTCIAIGVIDDVLYGSPLASGYGSTLSSVFDPRYIGTNIKLYSAWLLETHGPLIALVILGPFVAWRRTAPDHRRDDVRPMVAMLTAFAVTVLACAALYAPFDSWPYLRFVLPAFAPLFLLVSGAIAAAARFSRGFGIPVAALLVTMIAWPEIKYTVHADTLNLQTGERKYSAAASYVNERLPEKAAVLSMQHSGSVSYYSGRLIVRYDMIPPRDLDTVIGELRDAGYHPYLLLEQWEEDVFKHRFSGRSPLAALDWPPVAVILHDSQVRIYDPADYGRSPAGMSELVPVGPAGR